MPRSSASSEVPDHYATLGVSSTASQAAIRAAYRERAKETHPDRNPNDPEAAARFRRIQKAYAVLSDTERRRRYDARRAAVPDHVTATSIDSTGCVTYYLPRVAVGVVACLAFLALELADVWSTRDPWSLTLWIAGASALTSALAIGIFRAFPEETLDYAMRFRTSGFTIWVEGQTVAQVPWTGVQHTEEVQPNVWHIHVDPPAAHSIHPHPPIVKVDRLPSLGTVRLGVDLRETDVHRPSLCRFLAMHAPPKASDESEWWGSPSG